MDTAPPNYHEVISGLGKGSSADWTGRPSSVPQRAATGSSSLLHPNYAASSTWNRASSAPLLSNEEHIEARINGSDLDLPELQHALQKLPTMLRFQEDPNNAAQDEYKFYIRDKMDFLLFTGYVTPTHEITLKSVEETNFLDISAISEVKAKYTISHQQIHIFSLEIGIGAAQFGKATWSIDEQYHKISCPSPMDILISRNGGTLICKIHVPEPSSALDGKLLFTQDRLTAIEQSFCISTAVVFMAEKRRMRLKEHKEAQEQRRIKLIFLCILVAIGFGLVLSFLISCSKHY